MNDRPAAIPIAGARFDRDHGDAVRETEARRAGIPAVGVLTGGFSEQELLEAGAACVYDSLAELRSQLDALPLSE